MDRSHLPCYFYVPMTALTGSLPESLGDLTALYDVDLSSNHLTGSIPGSVLQGLTNLRLFMIDQNRFEGSFPEDIGKLEKLEFLYLSDNRFDGELPFEIFSKLKRLGTKDLLYLSTHLVVFFRWLVAVADSLLSSLFPHRKITTKQWIYALKAIPSQEASHPRWKAFTNWNFSGLEKTRWEEKCPMSLTDSRIWVCLSF